METLKPLPVGGCGIMDTGSPRAEHAAGVGQIGLVALFVTALVTAQLTASKILAFAIPFELPFTGAELVLPGAALAYAGTYFASDCYAELYGRKAATRVVNVAFLMNFVALLFVWSTIEAPVYEFSPVDAQAFADVLGASSYVVAGSLIAYLVSQNWDVFVFHYIRDRTQGEKLWLRNIGSTATSQAIDTVIFIAIAFGIAPALFGGDPLGLTAILGLIVGQYILKVMIALLDTPLVYLVVSFVRGFEEGAETPEPAA